MQAALTEHFAATNVLIMAAAVADFRVAKPSGAKLAKSERGATLELELNADIIATLAANKGARLVVGFAAETGDADTKAQKKLQQKKLDAVVANDVGQPGIGFDADDNEGRILFADGRAVKLPRQSKAAMAFAIWDALLEPAPKRRKK
jgi:phosphopantothenoylcysteine decarboxylase/phosphopantothenate--cysteine ligase